MSMLAGKTALIAGGGSGIWLASAKLFAAEGARLFISGRQRDALQDALARIGPSALAFDGDVADPAVHERVANDIGRRFGGLNIYVANAGVNTIRQSVGVSDAEYDAQFDVHERRLFGIQKSVPIMHDCGAITVTGSLASEKVLDGHAVYAGSKAATGAFARSWAIELTARKIRVNVLSPGPTDTAILDKLGIAPEQRGAFEDAMAAAIPLGRLRQPEELARTALFLASDASSFITGINLRVDGGMALL